MLINNENYILALTINERIAAFKENNVEMQTDSIFLDRWSNIRGLSTLEDTMTKCQLEGNTIDEFTYALKNFDNYEKEILEHKLLESEWFTVFQKIMYEFDNSEKRLEQLESSISYPFRPFILYIANELLMKVHNYKNITVSTKVINKISDWISIIITNIGTKVITKNLHDYKNRENIDVEFTTYMSKKYKDINSLLVFYSDYPVMVRMIVERLLCLLKHIDKAFKAIDSNVNWVKEVLNLSDIQINGIDCGKGDTHDEGQSVIVFEFAEGKKIVYKPKNLMIEKKFNELINWINIEAKDFILPMGMVRALYEEEYSLSCYIIAEECATEEEIKDFYCRLGQLIFLLYLINGKDFHYENIISSKGQVYIIDIETIFQEGINLFIHKNSVEDRLVRESSESILSMGVLPILGFNNNLEGKSIDISALNGKKQKTPFKVLKLKNVNTSDMAYEYDYTEISDCNNMPIYKGEKVLYTKYKQDIISGFNNMSSYIVNNKLKFIDKIKCVFNDNLIVRQLTRPTANYGSFLEFSNHPNYLKDCVYLERLLENLMIYPYKDKRIMIKEIEDMFRGDIPIFFSEIHSCDLICSKQNIIKDYFENTPFDEVVSKITELDSNSIDRQLELLKSSIGLTYDENRNRIRKINSINMNDCCYSDHRKDYEQYFKQINNAILNCSITDSDQMEITWYKNDSINYQIQPIDLYYDNGLVGIAIYFYQLYTVFEEESYLKVYTMILSKISSIPNVYFEKNPNNIAMLLIFSVISKQNPELFNEKLGLAINITKQSMMKDELSKNTFKSALKVLYNFYLNSNNDSVLKICQDLFDYAVMKYDFEDDDIIFVSTMDKLKNIPVKWKNITETKVAEILMQNPLELWRSAELDSYSNGILYQVNLLMDIYQLNGDEKVYKYACDLMNITINSYKINESYRLISDFNHMDVTLCTGYSGLSYSMIRVFSTKKLKNIFTLDL